MWNLKSFEVIYSRYESSGLKVRDFCANEVINEAKFYYWQKKLRQSKLPTKSFVPIVLDSNSAESGLSRLAPTPSSMMLSPEYEILYPCGAIFRVKGTPKAYDICFLLLGVPLVGIYLYTSCETVFLTVHYYNIINK